MVQSGTAIPIHGLSILIAAKAYVQTACLPCVEVPWKSLYLTEE